MNLLHHVYAVKNILAHGSPSDDFSFSNRLIAHLLQVSRSRLIEQKADKYNFISEQSYQSLCVDLAKASFHNCCEAPATDCQVLKSTIEIPRFLNTRSGNHLKVMDLEGTTINEYSLTSSKYSQYSLIGPQVGWFMHDNHLYVINNSFIETVLLNALFDNPQEINELSCPVDEDCTDFMAQEFPIDSDLVDPMYKMTIQMLVGSMELPKDLEQDAKDQTQ